MHRHSASLNVSPDGHELIAHVEQKLFEQNSLAGQGVVQSSACPHPFPPGMFPHMPSLHVMGTQQSVMVTVVGTSQEPPAVQALSV
jgi:hypothetical protein